MTDHTTDDLTRGRAALRALGFDGPVLVDIHSGTSLLDPMSLFSSRVAYAVCLGCGATVMLGDAETLPGNDTATERGIRVQAEHDAAMHGPTTRRRPPASRSNVTYNLIGHASTVAVDLARISRGLEDFKRAMADAVPRMAEAAGALRSLHDQAARVRHNFAVYEASHEARWYVRGGMDPRYTTPTARDAQLRRLAPSPNLAVAFLRGWVEHHPEETR